VEQVKTHNYASLQNLGDTVETPLMVSLQKEIADQARNDGHLKFI